MMQLKWISATRFPNRVRHCALVLRPNSIVKHGEPWEWVTYPVKPQSTARNCTLILPGACGHLWKKTHLVGEFFFSKCPGRDSSPESPKAWTLRMQETRCSGATLEFSKTVGYLRSKGLWSPTKEVWCKEPGPKHSKECLLLLAKSIWLTLSATQVCRFLGIRTHTAATWAPFRICWATAFQNFSWKTCHKHPRPRLKHPASFKSYLKKHILGLSLAL